MAAFNCFYIAKCHKTVLNESRINLIRGLYTGVQWAAKRYYVICGKMSVEKKWGVGV